MNKKKLILKVEKIGPKAKRVIDQKGTLDIHMEIAKGERVPKVSYWLAFLVLSKNPHITFYKQLEELGW